MGVCHSSKNNLNDDIRYKKNTDTIKSTNHLNEYKSPQSRTTGGTFQQAIRNYSEEYENDTPFDARFDSLTTITTTSSDSNTTLTTSILSADEYKQRGHKLSVIREYRQYLNDTVHEKKINPQWTKLQSVPHENHAIHTKTSNESNITIHEPLLINDNEILIMPSIIQNHEDLVQIPTYLYSYNIITGIYSKITEYPPEFPKGTHTTTIDRDNGIIYIFTENGYICSYNLNTNISEHDGDRSPLGPMSPSASLSPITSGWKWDIIHGVSIWNRHDLRNNTCSIMIHNKLHIISGKQHVVWNKNNKQLQLLHKLSTWNYAQMVYLKYHNKLMLVAGNDANNVDRGCATTLDTMSTYDLDTQKWMKLRNKLPFGIHKFGCVMTKDEQYVIMFGGNQLPYGCDYDGILIMNVNDYSVRQSKIRCPIEGSLYACLTVDYITVDLVIYGFVLREFRDFLSNDIIAIMKLYYCVENVHLFDRNGDGHWKMRIDRILG